MLIGLVAILLVGAIAYFHYVQGLFSATLSAILAIVSAVLALSYHEVLVWAVLRGKVADQAHALMLVALFAACYTILRVIFDSAIPGNVRLPVLLDKIGSAVMGAVAGVFAVGILLIAAQMLPFGPEIGGYARYALVDSREVRLPTQRQALDTYVYDVLKSDKLGQFDPNDRSSLILPVDDIVVATTRHLSDGGALAGRQSFSKVHPALLDELFGQRLGIQTGAKHVAYNLPGDQQVTLQGVYMLDSAPQADGEMEAIPGRGKVGGVLKPASTEAMLVVRLQLSRNASDSDNNVRISPGSVRLVANATNYYPMGTLDLREGPVVRVQRLDDFLIVPSDGVVDFVFIVPREDLGLATAAPAPRRGAQAAAQQQPQQMQIGPDVFLEAKRMGYIDLSGQEVRHEVPPAPQTGVMRKESLPKPTVQPGAAGTAAAAAGTADQPFVMERLEISNRLFTEVNTAARDGDAQVTFASGSASIRDNRFHKLEVNPTQTIALLSRGDYVISELWSPPGTKVVQIAGAPPSRAKDPWEWADKLGQFELIDANGATYKPRGAWARLKQGPQDRMVARYNAEADVTSVEQFPEARPVDVWIAFVVPENTTLKELRFAGKRIRSLNQTVQ
ncbi:CvpA family protein [Fontivita pretiosa]|uniref:CvpA family protein n=1 Tax=Fontivita pretiosa TaxID=2989684 RepID=UPI003D182275